MRPLRNSDGEIIYDGNGDDRRPLIDVDMPVFHGVVKLMERKAKLFGADLERSDGGGAPLTRELLAFGLGWDPTGSDELIDVDVEELPTD
jgi:hypothetical protein